MNKNIVLASVLFLISAPFLPGPVSARPPSYGEGNATQDKIRYCNMLVSRYGHLSVRINSEYYGIGVSRPLADKWQLEINSPGWFSKTLFISFIQVTKERYHDYEHRAVCKWEQDGLFEFYITHFERDHVTICDRYGMGIAACP